MKKNNYAFYTDFFKGKKVSNLEILVSKTKLTYLVGPLINEKFDANSFYKRVSSNCIYSPRIYKKMSNSQCLRLIEKYKNLLGSNEVIEIFRDGVIVKHKILKVPQEDNYEK